MTGLAVLLACAATLAPRQDGGHGRALELLAERRFGEALTAASAEPDARLRATAETEIAYAGRDFEGALTSARRALELAPGDLRMLQLASASALWLQDASLAEELARRFEEGVRSAALEADAHATWSGLARDYVERAAKLVRSEDERDGARSRARGVSIGVLGLALLAGAGLALARPRPGADGSSAALSAGA